MEDTHARVEEERALDSSRLRSSARLGFGAVSTVNTVAAATARISRRKRKKRRRQRRSSNDDVHLQEIDDVEVETTTTTGTTTGTTTTTSTATTRSETGTGTNNPSEETSGINEADNKSRSPRDENVEQQRVVRGGGSSRLASSTSVVQDNNTLLTRRVGKQGVKRCGNSNAGRRSAMTMDLQKLINEVHARPAIWDQKNVSYHNRDVILKLWREIAKACEVSTDVAKSKWKHLRDNFRNELKKTYRGKCEGNVSEHDSKWIWFRSLFFLRDQMNSRVIGCALSQNCANSMHSSPDGTQIEPQIDILEGHEETQFEDLDGDSCQSMISNDDGLHQVMPPPKLNKISRKRILMDAMDNDYVDVDRKRYESVQKRLAVVSDEEDDTYHFLMSVKNPLRSLPVDRQMFVRLKIQELVYNEINSQNQQGRIYDSSQDVKPPRNGNGTSGNVNASTGGETVSDVSNPASLLQNCTEGTNDETFFG